MLLERVDIDTHGPLQRVELGPFAEHINVVFGPEGSGKTGMVRFIRDSLVNRHYPIGMMSSSSGRVVWADRNGLLHCRREHDGTREGRRTIEFESRGNTSIHNTVLDHSWVGKVGTADDVTRAVHSIELPESIVDGVITDTHLTNVARVVSACLRSGLDSPDTYRSMPLDHSDGIYSRNGYVRDELAAGAIHNDAHRRTLREELASVEAELARLGTHSHDHFASLQQRRSEVASMLSGQHYMVPRFAEAIEPTALRDVHQTRVRFAQLHDEASRLRARREELNRWIADLDRQLASSSASNQIAARNVDAIYRDHSSIRDENLRRKLDDLDAQLIRWRRALVEVRGLRDAVLASQHQNTLPNGTYGVYGEGVLDEGTLRRQRLDGFMQAIDKYGYHQNIDSVLPIDELDSRIESATRQIDWLLQRYASIDYSTTGFSAASEFRYDDVFASDWYRTLPESVRYGNTTSIEETLRAIRNDLRKAAQYTTTRSDQMTRSASERVSNAYSDARIQELSRSERWLVAAIDRMVHHRESLLGHTSQADKADTRDWAETQEAAYRNGTDKYGHSWPGFESRYVQEREQAISELHKTDSRIESCLREAARVRQSMRSLPIVDTPEIGSSVDLAALESELRHLDAQLASASRVAWLQNKAESIHAQLRTVHTSHHICSPLSDAASQWLVRLTGGRLRLVRWQRDASNADLVTIDGRSETTCSSLDRAFAALAVRMAAGELLAQLGKEVPLVIETPRELTGREWIGEVASLYDHREAYHDHSRDGRHNHPLAAALRDYARAGRQILLLTSDQILAEEVARAGGRSFSLYTQRNLQPHLPLWRPHYQQENYAGPLPYVQQHDAYVLNSALEVNRDFDMAWREAYGIASGVHDVRSVRSDAYAHTVPQHISRRYPAATDLARDGEAYRDGFYYADSYTTRPESVQQSPGYASQYSNPQPTLHPAMHPVVDAYGHAAPLARQVVALGDRGIGPISGANDPTFFLTVDSPIDQAPSVDAIAAARLRGLSVTHITHLMQQDANRLADALGLANVDASTIRRWQNECRLVCRVPRLRGFDARVLVGCGVKDPAHLASIHPTDLLQRVEDFLATEEGQKVLLSGSSRELSRITSWIASANSWVDDEREGYVDGRTVKRTVRVVRDSDRKFDRLSDDTFDSERYEYDLDNSDRDSLRYGIRRTNDTELDIDSYGDSSRRRTESSRVNDSGRRSLNRRSSDNGRSSSSRRSSARSSNSFGSGIASGNGNGRRSGSGSGSGSGRSRRTRSTRTNSRTSSVGRRRELEGRDVVRIDQERLDRQHTERERTKRDREYEVRQQQKRDRAEREQHEHSEREPRAYERRERSTREYERRERSNRSERSSRSSDRQRQSGNEERELKFYLHRESPVVDAPSIGPRMAERLHGLGIYTVDDLLSADPQDVAIGLKHRRIDADTIRAWQHQATLVCRIPMLRGHDAQLLVLAEIVTPEELAVQDASALYHVIDPISRSKDGKRIIRGGKLPDLAEVTEWIQYAGQNRELVAA